MVVRCMLATFAESSDNLTCSTVHQSPGCLGASKGLSQALQYVLRAVVLVLLVDATVLVV